MTKTNKAQRKAIHRKWVQNDQGMSYRAFRKTVMGVPTGWTELGSWGTE